MKTTATILICFLLSLWTLSISSCNHYLDTTTSEREITLAQGKLKIYPDSNELVYRSNIALTADKESHMPKPFSTPLPKGLEWYEISNSSFFSFFYNKGQAILITINIYSSDSNPDSSYVPGSGEIQQYLSQFTTSANKKYDIRSVRFKPDRKQLVLVKGQAKILLYNILPGNYDLFLSCAKKLKFL